eukprot:3254601-Karenia_brevis.AAC.1
MVIYNSRFDHPDCATGATDWWAGWGWVWQAGQLVTGCKAKGWRPTTRTHTNEMVNLHYLVGPVIGLLSKTYMQTLCTGQKYWSIWIVSAQDYHTKR